MDFEQALDAHVQWKVKLSRYMAKPDRSLSPDTVGKDSECALGKWIYSDGRSLAAKAPSFEKLRTAHAEFHRQAADILRRADKGESFAGTMAIDNTSPYGKASLQVIMLIREVGRQVAG